jgi:hypothetical protein
MMRNKIAWAIVFGAAAVVASPAMALGPVDIEAGAIYWFSDTEVLGTSEGSDAPGAFFDLGLGDHWVIGASYYKVDPDSTGSFDFTNVNAKYKFLSASRNNFFAVGAGVERLSSDEDSSTSGRVFAEGRVSAKIVYFYARAAYLPSLGDIEADGGMLKGDTGKDFEAGVAVKPAPFIYLYAGYKNNSRKFEDPSTGDKLELKVDGPIAGVGFNF